MPLRVADQTHWCPEHPRSALGAAGLRRIDWARRPAAHLARGSTAGGASWRLAAAPGSFYLAHLPLERTKRPRSKDLAHPPQTHVRKKLEPHTTPLGTKAAADFALNGQRVGELQESFWTAAWRWITRLESRLRSQVQGHKAPARSTESV